jgi:hypothetical protein
MPLERGVVKGDPGICTNAGAAADAPEAAARQNMPTMSMSSATRPALGPERHVRAFPALAHKETRRDGISTPYDVIGGTRGPETRLQRRRL